MADVLNRTTKELLRSVHTPDYDPTEWIVNPTLPAAPPEYWMIEGDSVREMTPGEKSLADLESLPAIKNARTEELRTAAIDFVRNAYASMGQTVGLALMVEAIHKNYSTRLAALEPLLDFGRQVISRFEAARSQIEAVQTAAEVDAVTLDLAGLVAPQINIAAQAEVTE